MEEERKNNSEGKNSENVSFWSEKTVRKERKQEKMVAVILS